MACQRCGQAGSEASIGIDLGTVGSKSHLTLCGKCGWSLARELEVLLDKYKGKSSVQAAAEQGFDKDSHKR
jgi:hypothetical protein